MAYFGLNMTNCYITCHVLCLWLTRYKLCTNCEWNNFPVLICYFVIMIIMIIIIIIILQGLGHSRPVPVQNFNFWNYESIWTSGRTPWTGDQPNARPLPTQDNTTQKNADTHPRSERDLNTWSQVFQRSKTVRTLDCAATGTGCYFLLTVKLQNTMKVLWKSFSNWNSVSWTWRKKKEVAFCMFKLQV
jgi:hypothetical protein